MSDCYTPTDGEVLEAWAAHNTPDLPTALDLVGAYDAFKRWLAEHDAKVRAETLRDAASRADEWRAANGMHGGEWFPSEWAGQVAGWLEHRADRIEREAGLK